MNNNNNYYNEAQEKQNVDKTLTSIGCLLKFLYKGIFLYNF